VSTLRGETQGRTEEDLRLAVRELFDVLEKLRPEMKEEMLSKDEGGVHSRGGALRDVPALAGV
jgi:hypothetical protein